MNCNEKLAQPGYFQPLAYSVADVCRFSSLGKTHVYKLIKEGKLTARKIGNRTLVTAESLRRLIEQGE